MCTRQGQVTMSISRLSLFASRVFRSYTDDRPCIHKGLYTNQRYLINLGKIYSNDSNVRDKRGVTVETVRPKTRFAKN